MDKIKVLVMFLSIDELPFARLAIPRYLDMFASATLYVFATDLRIRSKKDYHELLSDFSDNIRVVFLDVNISGIQNGLPVGFDSMTAMLDSMHIACAMSELEESDIVVRVFPYSIPVNTNVYYGKVLASNAKMYMSCECVRLPFDYCNYFLTAGICFSLLRLLSFLPGVSRKSVYADIVLQGLLFSMYCENLAVYNMRHKTPGCFSEHSVDYDKLDDADYLEMCRVSCGTLYFSNPNVPVDKRVEAAKKVINYIDNKKLPA